MNIDQKTMTELLLVVVKVSAFIITGLFGIIITLLRWFWKKSEEREKKVDLKLDTFQFDIECLEGRCDVDEAICKERHKK